MGLFHGACKPQDWAKVSRPRSTSSHGKPGQAGQALRDRIFVTVVLTQSLKPIPFRIFLFGEFFRRSFAAVWYRERFDGLRPSFSAHVRPTARRGRRGRWGEGAPV